MRLLVDTDVLIDVALDRAPHAAAGAALLDALESRPGTGCIALHSASNFYYLVTSQLGDSQTRAFLYELTRFLDIAPTTTESLRIATKLPMSDFEDAMQVTAAISCQAELIATRNAKDFAISPIPAASPDEALARLTESGLP